MSRLLALVFSSLAVVTALHGQTQSIWNNDGSGDALWSNPANWSEGVPDSSERWAVFRYDHGSREATLDQDARIGRLVFEARGTDTGYVLKGERTLSIDVNDPDAFRLGIVGLGEGANTVECPVEINNSQNAATNIQAHAASVRLVFKGPIIAATYLNFGGVEGGETVVEGAIVNHRGVRFGQSGVVTISGTGVSSDEGGNLVFASGIINLNRPGAVSGRKLIVTDVPTINFNSSESITPEMEAFVEGAALWNFRDASQTFGPLMLSASLEVRLEGKCELRFSDCSRREWTGALNISGFVSGQSRVRFGDSAKGLSSDQLARVTINKKPAKIDAQGFLQPL